MLRTQFMTWTRNASCGHIVVPTPAPTPAPAPVSSVGAAVTWAPGSASGAMPAPASFAPLPTALLMPTLSAAEAKRSATQRALATGWGCWANSVLDLVLLPEAARLTAALCQLSSGSCVAATDPSDTGVMRAAEHAYDKSYVRMFVMLGGANISIAFSDDGSGSGHSGSGHSGSAGLSLLATPAPLAAGGSFNASDFTVVLLGDFAWGRAGAASVDSDSGAITLAATGLRSVTLAATRAPLPAAAAAHLKLPAAMAARPRAAFLLGVEGLGVGDGATAAAGVAALGTTMARRLAAELATYEPYGALAATKRATQAGVMWCLIYVPSEFGPFAPVYVRSLATSHFSSSSAYPRLFAN